MQSLTTRYIYIDPSAQKAEARAVNLEHKAMLGIICCESLEAVRLPSGDILWFDGEPVAYNIEQDGIEIAGIAVLGSRCMIIGPDDPTTELPTDCRMTVEEVSATIKWMPRRKIVGETFRQTSAGFEISYLFDPA